MYITTPLAPRYPQIPIESLFDFSGAYDNRSYDPVCDPSATYTAIRDKIPESVYNSWRPERLLNYLMAFNEDFKAVINHPDYRCLYNHYEIPKRNGKLRPIDEPLPQLRAAQDKLVDILKVCMPANHHASAYAYIEKRAPVNAAEKHQKNESNWYAKFDFTNFFGHITPDFVFRMLRQIYPFAWVYDQGHGKVIEDAFSVCFLRGGLPQGSPISPMLTNIVMIPIDHYLCNTLHNYQKKSFIYTRYADDMQISCKYGFSVHEMEKLIIAALRKFNAPFPLNKEKTHYGSRAGRNAMLGVHINANNEITVGHENKRFMKAMLTNYIMDKKSKNRRWDLEDVQRLQGKLNSLRQIEPSYFDAIVDRLGHKFNINIMAAMKEDIKMMSA